MEMEGLSAICGGLGLAAEDDGGRRIGYVKDEYCLDNLKDLLRFLRRDDPQTREVFKQVCKWNIVAKDLIPIIEHYQDDRNLVLNAVKILVFLTMPIEPSSNDIPLQIEYLWGLKSSITHSNTVAVVVSLLEGPLENLECEALTEDDWKLVQLVLTLFRNILAIQEISSLQKAGGSALQYLSLRDRFLELLFHENVMDLIIVITQHIGGSSGYFREDNLLLLEIYHYIFFSQDSELIAKAHSESSKVGEDNKASLDGLKSIMKEEQEKRKHSRLQNISRHSQFNGTFTRLTVGGSKAVFKGNPSSTSLSSTVKSHKGHRPNKRIVQEHGHLPSTKSKILELLHDFINQFLSGGYNVLVQSICDDIEKEHHAIQNSDIIVFFQVAQFITSFQYHKFFTSKPTLEPQTFEGSPTKQVDVTYFNGEVCGPIAASMNESMFSLVISRWRNAFDGLKETNNYKFLSAAGSLMKNMIYMLDLVLKLLPEDSKEPQTTRILLYKLFYDQTEEGMTQFLLNLIKTFDTHRQPKSDLADLVGMIYVIVCLMENLQARGTLRVSKRSRKGKKKRVAISREEGENKLSGDHPPTLNDSNILTTEQTTDFSISRKDEPAKMTSDGEKNTSGSILPDEPIISVSEVGGNLLQMDNKKPNHVNDLCCSTSDSSGDEQPAVTDEVDLKVSTLISGFANSSIIQNICWLLKFYKTNSIQINDYIIGILQRVTDDLELSPMLYQLSLLVTFHNILDEQKSCPSEDYANIVDFLTSLVRKMLRKIRNQPLLFVELLFWKTRRECHYIDAEYLLHELGAMKKEIRNLDNISENGEISSSQSKVWTNRSIADALGEDEADVIISHDQHQNEESCAEHAPEKACQRKRRLAISDDMETKIKDLYDKFKDDRNCYRLIAESLDPDGRVSAAQVSNKLKQLGLDVSRKKRMRNAAGYFSANPNQHKVDGHMVQSESILRDSNALEGSSSRQPSNTRKRVSAFNKDQETMIKDLFEQFKDQKRCSYLIANAMGADTKFTAAQVSSKLKQLGLLVPWKKRAKANMQLIDEEDGDFSADKAFNSDNETLLAFRNRGKRKSSGKLADRELPNLNIEDKMTNDSDDETLSSVLKKTRKLPANTDNEKLTAIQREREIVKTICRDRYTKDNTERDMSVGTSRMDVSETNKDGSSFSLGQGISETEADYTTKINLPVSSSEILEHEQLDDDDELADSGDDLPHNESNQIAAINRRKLRLVLDFEDDD